MTALPCSSVVRGDQLIIALPYEAIDTQPTAAIAGVVVGTTPKAIRLNLAAERGGSQSLWLPRRALTRLTRDKRGLRADLARWWRPDERQRGAVQACAFDAS